MTKKVIGLFPFLLTVSLYCHGANNLISGQIYMVGNEPFTKLVCKTDTGQYLLTGDLVAELKQFQGFEVKLSGEVKSPKAEFEVREYQLLIYDQNVVLKDAWVGIIRMRIDNLYLETTSGRRYKLSGKLLPELKRYTQHKLWITGILSKKWFFGNTVLTVDSYGVIQSNTNRVMIKQ